MHVKTALRIWFLLLITFTTMSCSKLAVMFTPTKSPLISKSSQATTAKQLFWSTLHHGRYDQIPETLKLLTAAYLENPNDPNLAAYLGFEHIWKIAERQRVSTLEPAIVDEMVLSRKYFADALALTPNDSRIRGFYGDATIAEGKIFGDQREQVQGYFILLDAIHAWPQFNYFTAGYIFSVLPAHSKQFAQALNWQWQTLDRCANQSINRASPDFAPFMRLETPTGPNRACWNSWIAPHNFEGFFLNMGDMLVKLGDWQTAIKIYRNAKLSKTYHQWKYSSVLEQRIKTAKENVTKFNLVVPLTARPPQTTMMFNSRFSCSACHER